MNGNGKWWNHGGHLAMHSRSLKTSTQNSLMGPFHSMLSAMLGGIGINCRIVGEGFFLFFVNYSQCVPWNVPNNISFLISYCLAMVQFPLYISCGGRGLQRKAWQNVLLFWGGKHIFRVYVEECPMLQKYWWWANQMAPSAKTIKNTNYGCH